APVCATGSCIRLRNSVLITLSLARMRRLLLKEGTYSLIGTETQLVGARSMQRPTNRCAERASPAPPPVAPDARPPGGLYTSGQASAGSWAGPHGAAADNVSNREPP